MRTSLLLIYGTGNLLAAISALRWYHQLNHPEESLRVITIVDPPGQSPEAAIENNRIISKVISSQSWDAPLFLDTQQIQRLTPSLRSGKSCQSATKDLIDIIGIKHVDEIFYSHDIGRILPGMLTTAFPKAVPILFGDGLGSVYNNFYHMALIMGATLEEAKKAAREGQHPGNRNPKQYITHLIKKILVGEFEPVQPLKAVLAIPMDQTGTSLKDVELIIIQKETVLDVIKECQIALPELAKYSQKILNQTNPPQTLVLLENLTDAGLADLDKEVSYYEAVIRENVPKDGTVLIKSHPLSSMKMDEKLHNRIKNDFHSIILEGAFARYPIEFWSKMIASCRIIGIAYSSVTLAYLYNKNTTFALTDDMIEEYIQPKFWALLKDAAHLYQGQIDNLKTWDTKGILWKGNLC